MSSLKDLVERTKEAQGLLYNLNMEILRNYIKTMPEDEIIKEVYQLQTLDDIRILWSAGLKSTVQHHALERGKQIRAGK